MEQENSLFHKLGENYEYLKTIVDNKLELKKLELMDVVAQVVSKSIYWAVLLLVMLFSLSLLTCGAVVLLAQVLDSVLLALFITSAFYLFVGLLVFLLFDKLFQRPILNGIHKFLSELDEQI